MSKINSFKKKLAHFWSSIISQNDQGNEENRLKISFLKFLEKAKSLATRFSERFYNNEDGLPSFLFIASVYVAGRMFVEVLFPETKLAMYLGFAFIGLAIYVSIAFLPNKAASSQESEESLTTCIVTSSDNKALVESVASKLSLSKSKQTWYSKVGARISITEKKKNLWMSVSYGLNVTRFDPPSKNKYDPDQLPSLVPHGLQDGNAVKSLLKQTDMSLSENTRGAVLWLHEPVKSYSSKEWETYKTKLSSEVNNRYFELNQTISTLFPRFEFIPYSPNQKEEPGKTSLAENDRLEFKERLNEIQKLNLGPLKEKHEGNSIPEIPTGGV
jgi:hypothetical protein